jgi:signal transduction histidine kinase
MAQLEIRREMMDLRQASLEQKREIARLEKKQAEFESTLKAKGEFLQKLGQEMRTGLKVLYSLSNQIGETGPLTDAQKESVALAQSTCSSLLEITRQVLDRPEPPLPAA